MLDGRVLEASQVEYKPFGKPPLQREGGHFGSQICESAQERHHVLFRHGEMKVGLRCSLSVTAF